jgi:parallel beta-helix repeat protein
MTSRRPQTQITPLTRRVAHVGVALAVIILSLAVQAGAMSSTLYVDQGNPNCSNTGPGTEAEPFCSIKSAASRVTAGETVLVASGTYDEGVTVSSSGTPTAPVSFAAAPGANVTVRGATNGFYISGRSYVTVEGFHVTDTSGDGIVVKNSSSITLRGNRASFAGEPILHKTAKGIRVEGSTDSVLESNTVDHNTSYGIYLLSGSTRNRIVGNESFANASVFSRMASGIRIYVSTGNTISSNVTHDNEDSGIELFNTAGDNVVVNNVTYGNGDHGIDNLDSPNQVIVSNSVYDNFTAGINVEGTSSGASLANNVSVDNGLTSTRTKGNIRIDSTSISGATVDYDLVHLRTSGTMFTWGSTGYVSLAAFVAATGKEAHGIQASPRWAAPDAGNFHLTAGSPAVDSADSGAPEQPATDALGNPRVDDPATPNTGAGPRAYDDRGAFELPATDAPPTAALSVTPNAGTGPLEVTADASASTDVDATPIAGYKFDFGDGTVTDPQAAPEATHTYGSVTSTSDYTVTVIVIDTAGQSSTASTQVTVNPAVDPADEPPSPALTVTPSAGVAPMSVTADASGSTDTDDTPIQSYRFSFGDGSPVVGPQANATATHSYGTAGTYTASVTVTDTAGKSSTATTQVTVIANLVANPGFESDLTGWNTSGSGAGISLTRAAGGHSGSWSARLQNTGTGASSCLLNDSPNWVTKTSTGTYTASLWARADSAGAVLKLRLREYDGSVLVGTSVIPTITLSTAWQELSVSYAAASPGTSTLDLSAYVSGAAPGTCFYADDVVLTRG